MSLAKDPIGARPPPASSAPLPTHTLDEAADRLANFLDRHPRTFVLTGAGLSTDSGIPDYRDRNGAWKRRPPVQHQDFMAHLQVRQRYWGRSLIGWPVVRDAQPNSAHRHLAELERRDYIGQVVTQNVDRLHQRAGSHQVIDLHGRADEVVCMGCGERMARCQVHQRCWQLNPDFRHFTAQAAPDGDADLELDFSEFRTPDCHQCGGILKPDVVFFGANVPKPRLAAALAALQSSDALLVVGSSLMVFSGFRFCRHAADWGIPMATLNLGHTRADGLADLKLNARITETLALTLARL
ncbi:NAD-dependent protein deacetylase [Marinobacter sp. X15-166B]|uniref:NAD-dependent protein deacetylase n=1 Tax=Marinobacter sp. X15-166B TaxID=1897620 RepID=UPI00085C5CEB|nr:NAD-dependent protein deacetylase [Marinobacter sp. X15-166B]OEY67509.1 NAD-dependent deacetylase [Marinobacter sp. X15-166B]